jgi:O-antigen/teichoic acid export membrane protein
MAFIYGVPTLLLVIPVASLVLVISGFNSISPALLQRKLQIGKLSIFEIIVTLIFAIAQIALAYLNPTIWALVFGLLVGSSATMIGSYFLIPELKHKFKISKSYFWQIIGFGKWIFISSAIFFFSMNFDRLYLAGVIPLALLGVYGIARSISELLSMLVARLGNIIIFPLIASYSNMARSDLYEQLASIRLRFLLFAALVFSVFAATADFAIRLIFDQRYHAAGWMLPVLIIGAWFSIMCNLNESVLLGLSKPQYSSIANGLKFAWLLIGLPLSFVKYGAVGAIIVVAISDLWRYTPIFIGQVRERFSFGKQDVLTTIIVLSLIGILEWLRWVLGLGTSFEDMPIASLI